MTEKHKGVEIEFEQVTLVMDYTLLLSKGSGCTLEEDLEYYLLDDIRAEIEGTSGEELAKMLGLAPVFYKVLGDKHYKPEPDC